MTPPELGTRALDAAGDPAFAALCGPDAPVPAAQFGSVPAIVDAAHLSALARLARLLDAAFRAIVARYFEDPRIRAVYRLPEALERILLRARDRPYRVGHYRPDFVYDTAGHPRICEIGARYPLNGWIVSLLAAEAYAPAAARLGLRTQSAQAGFLRDLLALHPPGATVAMVHEREAGTEIFHLREALRRQGTAFVQVAPGRLGAVRGRLAVDGRPIDRAILELDRSELPAIADDALDALLDGDAYFNDVRTLILVHDKRVLAVLCDEAIMRDCLPADELAALRPFLIPSWAPASAEDAERLLTRPENLIAKRSSGGRGLGALVRDGADPARWRALVRAHWAEYMFQAYLPQRAFVAPEADAGGARIIEARTLEAQTLEARTPETRTLEARIHLVGMQLCRDATSFGVGVFRGSDEAIINLHQNRGRLYPALVRA